MIRRPKEGRAKVENVVVDDGEFMLSVGNQNNTVTALNNIRENFGALFTATNGSTPTWMIPTLGILSVSLIAAGILWVLSQGTLRRRISKQIAEVSFQLSRAKHRVQNYEKILQRHYALATKPIISELSVIRRIVGCLEERLLTIENELTLNGSVGLHEAAHLCEEPLDINCGKNAIFEVVVGKISKNGIGELQLGTVAEELTKHYQNLDEMLRDAWAEYEDVVFAQ